MVSIFLKLRFDVFVIQKAIEFSVNKSDEYTSLWITTPFYEAYYVLEDATY